MTERTNSESQVSLWSALADIPPPSVEIPKDTTIRMTNRHFRVRVGDRSVFVGYDTGASLSVLYDSIARELDVAIYGPRSRSWPPRANGSMAGRASYRRSLGSIVIRNAVFLVLRPDDYFPSAKDRFGVDRRGLLGAPVLEAFREVTETSDGVLIIPAEPGPRPVQNMCLSGYMPVVEAVHRGARMSLCLDTGSSVTFLYPPFYRRYRGEIKARSSLRKITVGGVGGSRTVPVYVLDAFAFRAGGKDLSLRKVLVHAEETHADSRYFHGTLGVDIMSQCSRMSLNFESMSFVLE